MPAAGAGAGVPGVPGVQGAFVSDVELQGPQLCQAFAHPRNVIHAGVRPGKL